jgi:iron complex transport system ATP-binding protein
VELALPAMTPDKGNTTHWRIEAEQATFAYVTRESETPRFSLGPMTLAARAGQFVALLGANGSGKSTALRLLSGSLKPLAGHVRLEGAEVSELLVRERAQRIALVSQESALLFPVRVWEYVLQGRYPFNRRMHFESAEDCAWASRALEDVAASHLSSRWISELSGGEKQRVVLARALAQQPTLLLLDEPTQHLDISARVELMRTLWRLSRGSNRTVIIVTHELNLAAGFCDQVALLHHGKFLGSGTPREIYRREILEEAFEAPLEVQWSPDGLPRVVIHNRPEMNIASSQSAAESGEGFLTAT